ncbi:MAG: AAA family ATPase [Bacteroidales bacterium]|nr:AAA family ATPase [Bacteroidales bacterium]
MNNEISPSVQLALNKAAGFAGKYNTQYITPEIYLLGLLSLNRFRSVAERLSGGLDGAEKDLAQYVETSVEKAEGTAKELELSFQLMQVLQMADVQVTQASADRIDIPHVVYAMYQLEDSYAAFWLKQNVSSSQGEVLSALNEAYADGPANDPAGQSAGEDQRAWMRSCRPVEVEEGWHLVGRGKELSRALLVLCRKEKCNPVFVGEHGVGKTAIVRGLAAILAEGDVPERLKGKKLYCLDFPSVISGAQFRGDLERRMKEVLDGVAAEGDIILFIDNIHEIVGAGRTGDGATDATSLLVPYIERRDISFIGATTFEEYKRSVNRSKNLERLFQKIEVEEPSREEAVRILDGLRGQFEAFHGVRYADGVIPYAVESGDRYIHGRFLPEKAVDLLDESGAYLEMHPSRDGKQVVDKELLKEVLSRISGIDLTDKGEGEDAVYSLKDELKRRIFGQDSAIDTVCDAVYTAKAGLSDAQKPMASFLFVGPTGVGKTQLARDLSDLLRMPLLRYDMSEYAEKHTVSKFIGAPAGYVGYEDGGILVDAVRRSPHCVLLLDEIEKAHQDIYNLLLQIMDYGTLTDSRGRKADFRNAIIILTSNAGAKFASRPSIGFSPIVNAGEAMNREVKNVFAPEFVNRLSATVVFNNLSEEMAHLIVEAKIREFDAQLQGKGVRLTYTDEASAEILRKGYSQEYGAREIERVITRDVKPLVVKEILFGFLKDGGEAEVDCSADGFILKKKP